MSDELLEYRSVMYRNSEVFLFNYKEEFAAFGVIVDYLNSFLAVVSTQHMNNGKSLVGFIPHLSIIHRQYLNSFQNFATFQSYQGWVLLRPAIESILIMGKWLDDRDNFEVWKKHEQDWKSYNSVYSGKNLASKSLSNSDLIQSVLKKLNDKFMHANPSYYNRHSSIQQVDAENYHLWTSFFDDQKEHQVHLYAYLHFTIFMLHSAGMMFQPLFSVNEKFKVDLSKFQRVFENKVRAIANESLVNHSVLLELGLWPNHALEPIR